MGARLYLAPNLNVATTLHSRSNHNVFNNSFSSAYFRDPKKCFWPILTQQGQPSRHQNIQYNSIHININLSLNYIFSFQNVLIITKELLGYTLRIILWGVLEQY